MEKTIPEADNSRDNICDAKSFCHATKTVGNKTQGNYTEPCDKRQT